MSRASCKVTWKNILVILLVVMIILCVIGFLFAPNDPASVNLKNRLAEPSKQYPFGTDSMGRCVLSRILAGGHTTLGIVLGSMAFIVVIGLPVGLLLGMMRPSIAGTVLESILNAITAIPPIAYLIVFIGAWGSSVFTLMVALTLSLVLRVIRLIKAQTYEEHKKAYVLCAVAAGASGGRILFVHILPNVLKETIVFLSLSCADMIVMITSFSFIGLGPGDNVIDWGSMIQEAQSVALMRPELIIYPIAFVIFSTVAFNVFADTLE